MLFIQIKLVLSKKPTATYIL